MSAYHSYHKIKKLAEAANTDLQCGEDRHANLEHRDSIQIYSVWQFRASLRIYSVWQQHGNYSAGAAYRFKVCGSIREIRVQGQPTELQFVAPSWELECKCKGSLHICSVCVAAS
jgi:hypothetical protein